MSKSYHEALKSRDLMIGLSFFLKSKDSRIKIKLLSDQESLRVISNLSIKFPWLISREKDNFVLNLEAFKDLFLVYASSISDKDLASIPSIALFKVLYEIYNPSISSLMDLFSNLIAFHLSKLL